MEQQNLQEKQTKKVNQSNYNEVARLWMENWNASRWGRVVATLNKKEQAQLKQCGEVVKDIGLLTILLNYYFTNFNEAGFEKIRWKSFIPSPGHFLARLKEIHAMYLNIQAGAVKPTGQYDGSSSVSMGAEWSR